MPRDLAPVHLLDLAGRVLGVLLSSFHAAAAVLLLLLLLHGAAFVAVLVVAANILVGIFVFGVVLVVKCC